MTNASAAAARALAWLAAVLLLGCGDGAPPPVQPRDLVLVAGRADATVPAPTDGAVSPGSVLRAVPAGDGGWLVADAGQAVLWRVDGRTQASLWAGDPFDRGVFGLGASMVDGDRFVARMVLPSALAVDVQGGWYMGDLNVLRHVDAAGALSTRATVGSEIIIAVDASAPPGVLVAAANIDLAAPGSELYATYSVRRCGASGRCEVLLRGSDQRAPPGRLRGMARAADGGIHLAIGDALYRMAADNSIALQAGLPGEPGSADGPASSARFRQPSGLAVDSDGSLWVADTGNHTVRRVSSSGQVDTVLGVAGRAGLKLGPLPGGLDRPTDISVTAQGLLVSGGPAVVLARR